MKRSRRRLDRAAGEGQGSEGPEAPFSLWTILLLVEFVALLIGLVMPITPSKTGSDVSLADYVFDSPSYLQEVLVYFVLTNLVLGVLALIALLMIKIDARRSRADG